MSPTVRLASPAGTNRLAWIPNVARPPRSWLGAAPGIDECTGPVTALASDERVETSCVLGDGADSSRR